jgi:hypothetical protein
MNTTRHYAAAALVLALVLLGTGAAQNGKAESKGPKPSIEIPEMRHDLGKIFEREKYEYTFTVRNRGNGDLVIEEVKPG